MKFFENLPYKDTGLQEHMLDMYLPDTDVFPVFIYFHGGGIEAGTKSDDKFYPILAQKGIGVVTANYRMYPTAKFPEFIEDCAAVVAWVHKNIHTYGKVTKIFVGGSSAGGYISQMLCFHKEYLAAYEIDADSLGGFVLDAGQPTTHFNVLRERGLDTRCVIIDDAAPLYYIREERDYAPMQIIVSDKDMMNRLEQTYLLVNTLKHFGYDEKKIDFRLMENSTHCCYVNAKDDNGEWIFVKMIAEFIQRETA